MIMNKSIVIIDTPDSCNNCPLCIENCFLHLCCAANEYERILDYKPDWCPLKPLPEKRDERGTWTMCGYIDDAYSNGWNDCLDEILEVNNG